MTKVYTLLYYKFVDIEEPKGFVKRHLKMCKKLGLLGKVLVGKEGINGSVCGNKEQVERYKEELRKDPRFSDIVFKEDIGDEFTFTKMAVRVRDEIIALNKKVDLSMKAPYITPKELLEMYKNGEDFVILDARNDYEWKVGKFKNAKVLPIKTFRQFPDALEKVKDELRGKKIITYCTGGIRCEKASALMRQEGLENVYQLQDGILNYCKELPNTNWEGKCFVFDKRLVSDVNNAGNTMSKCELCSKPCDLYRNCKNNNCDRLAIMCLACEKKMNACCCEKCLEEFRLYCLEKSVRNQGKKVLKAVN